MGNLFTQGLVDCFSTHHHQGNIRLRWYGWLVFRGSLYRTVTGTVGFHYNNVSTTFHE
jgi:hypothetical protein